MPNLNQLPVNAIAVDWLARERAELGGTAFEFFDAGDEGVYARTYMARNHELGVDTEPDEPAESKPNMVIAFLSEPAAVATSALALFILVVGAGSATLF